MIDFYASGTERRTDILLGPLKQEYMRNPPIKVLDVGCGYASIPVFLAWQWPQSEIYATDRTDSYFSCGARAAAEAGVCNIHFEIEEVGQINYHEEFDLVLSCNMLNYMTSRQMLDDTLTRLAAATKPGGRLITYTPHFWSYREPFTYIPCLHFLPRAMQDRIVRGLGKRSGLLDVRNPSLREISNSLDKNGFRRIGVEPAGMLARVKTTHLTAWFEKP
jgi:ubiquinone/menaquinone biosynthesis C-methylase UbiE